MGTPKILISFIVGYCVGALSAFLFIRGAALVRLQELDRELAALKIQTTISVADNNFRGPTGGVR